MKRNQSATARFALRAMRDSLLKRAHGMAWLACGLSMFAVAGCAATRPLDGVPARYLPHELRGESREDARMIDLSLLRRSEPAQHIIDAGDVLAVYIENILGQREQPPINQAFDGSRPPTLGFPVMVQDDGTLSLPLIPPIMARGKTIPQLQRELVHAYTVHRRLLPPGQERILVTLHRARTHRVLVVRQESQSDIISAVGVANGTLGSAKKGTGHVVTLPAYKNDVMNALVMSGGLPGLDAQNIVYVIRGRKVSALPGNTIIRGQSPQQGRLNPPADIPQPLPSGTGRSGATFSGSASAGQMPAGPPRGMHQPGSMPLHGLQPSGAARTWQPIPQIPSYPLPSHPQYPARTPALVQTPTLPGAAASGPHGYIRPTVPSGLALNPVAPGWQPPPLWNNVNQIASGAYCNGPHVIRIPLRLSAHESPQISEADVTLYDGDIVFIASRDDELFYTGGLLGGGEYTLPRDRDIDILEAIAISEQSQNAQQNSGRSALNADVSISPSEAIILRKLPNGTQVPILVNLYRARRYPAERINIQPGDYIIVQYTKLEAIGAFIERHILESALFGVAASQVNAN